MKKVQFKLQRDFRIANYLVVRRLCSGCTAEAYLVEEVPTKAVRVLKLFEQFEDSQLIKNMRDFEHYCWLLEQLSVIGLLPRYYHMGHLFLKPQDGIGNFYLVQEFVKGVPFTKKRCSEAMIRDLYERVELTHRRGYALGDWEPENLIISSERIRMVDCSYGRFDAPNPSQKADVRALKALFGK